jgi:hypothetical protein
MNENRTTPMVPMSVGELLDKITILEIKNARIEDPLALMNVKKELDLLTSLANDLIVFSKDVVREKEFLLDINTKLWEIEDRIRGKEAAQQFDDEFVELARSVYKTNDERSAIKKRINKLLLSDIIEEKKYNSY